MQLEKPARGGKQAGEPSHPPPPGGRPRTRRCEDAHGPQHDQRTGSDGQRRQTEDQWTRTGGRRNLAPHQRHSGGGQPAARARHTRQRPQRTRQAQAGTAGDGRPDRRGGPDEQTESADAFRDRKGTQDLLHNSWLRWRGERNG